MKKSFLLIRKLFYSILWNIREALPKDLQSILFEPPKMHMVTEEYCRRNNLPYTVVRKPYQHTRVLPDTPDSEIHWKFHKKKYFKYPKTWIAELSDPIVIGKFGHVLSKERILLIDGSSEFGMLEPSEHKLYTEYATIPKKQYLEGCSTILTGPSTRNYYHWLADSLSRLQMLEKKGWSLQQIDHFIIPSSSLSAIKESLKALGISDNRLIEINSRLNIRLEKLVLPSMPSKGNNPSPGARDFLRKKFLPLAAQIPDIFPKRYYIPREKSRVIINESELYSTLRKNSVEIVRPESLSFIEQVALFSRAELIIAPHGAALANLLFSPPKSSVIEIFSPNYVNICYWALCNHGGIKYSYILGDGKRPKRYHDPHNVRENIIAPINILDNWIQDWVE